jgi:hypothetical protein
VVNLRRPSKDLDGGETLQKSKTVKITTAACNKMEAMKDIVI